MGGDLRISEPNRSAIDDGDAAVAPLGDNATAPKIAEDSIPNLRRLIDVV